MADYEKGQEVVTRVRYRLRTPTNAVEVSKMITAAAQERANQLGHHNASHLSDDALTVDVRDDEIVVWWEVAVAGGEAGHTG